MNVLYLALVFAVIVGILAMRRPLYLAIGGGLLAMILLYRFSPSVVLEQFAAVFRSWDSMQVLLSLYLITWLQRLLERRQIIMKGQQALNGLFHNRRINAGGAPVFIGLLPSAAAMTLCADIVKESTDGYLNPREQAFITSWMRHLPECMLPTNPAVLLMVGFSGIPVSRFMLGMLVPALTLGLLAYFPYLRRLKKEPDSPASENQGRELVNMLRYFWPLLLIITLIMGFNVQVVPAALLVLLAMVLICGFKPAELWSTAKSAFEGKVILSTFLLLLLKEFIGCTRVMEQLPALLSGLPIPTYMVFVLLFFLGGIVSGSSGIIALGMPLVSSVMGSGLPVVILLMCISHGANQLSPVHICLEISASYYKVSMGELIRKSILPVLIFCLLMLGYYQLLLAVC